MTDLSARDRLSFGKGDAGDYALGADSEVRDDVPRGTLVAGRLDRCRTYPDNGYDFTLYLPAGHDIARSIELFICLDGSTFLAEEVRMPTVLDNLIGREEIPAVAALFVDAGENGPGLPVWGGEGNRSVEYDSTDGTYARFLLDELVPCAARAAGLKLRSYAIAGISSGGAAAFTAAWHHPDLITKVASFVGSFTAIRGADCYPNLIRREDCKPIRVFLQSGREDLDVVFGHWPLANQQMAAALAYKNYDFRFEFGRGGHSMKHGAAILPDVLRWLWRAE